MVRSVILQLSPLSGNKKKKLSYIFSHSQFFKLFLHSVGVSAETAGFGWEFSSERVRDKQIWSILKQINNSFTDCNTSHTQKNSKEWAWVWISFPQTSEMSPEPAQTDTREEKWREEKCASRPCAVSHMNEQQHMTYPQILWIFVFLGC